MAHKGRANADGLLALALASGLTLRRAARNAAISERTAARRLDDPDFRARVAELRKAMVGRAVGTMCRGMAAAARKLRKLLDSEDERIALGACKALLELTVKLRDTVDLEERLRSLEEQLKGKDGRS